MLSWCLHCDNTQLCVYLTVYHRGIKQLSHVSVGIWASSSAANLLTVVPVANGNDPHLHCALAEVAPVVLYHVLVQCAIKQGEWSPR